MTINQTPEEYLSEFIQYDSVKRYLRHLKKKAASMENGSVPFDTLEHVKYSLRHYTAWTGKNPDELIAQATESIRRLGTTLEIDDQLDSFWEAMPTKTTAAVFFSFLKSFYRFNGVRLTAATPGTPKVRKNIIHLDNDMIRRICDVMPLQHASWFLSNNYMGLRLGGFRNLMVEDFHTENFEKNMPLYPVFVSKQVSGFFDYTTYIGYDAMMKVKTYIAREGFGKKDKLWNFSDNYLIKKFKAYAYQAGVIDAPHGLGQYGEPLGMCMLGTHAQRRRRNTIQESVGTNRNWCDHLIGHVPKGANAKSYSFPEDATPEDLYNEVLKALPKLEIYGHHELSPTEPTVQLRRMRIYEEAKAMKHMTPEKLQQLENILKCIRTKPEMDGALENIMVVTRKIE
jgi:hypothetical protein